MRKKPLPLIEKATILDAGSEGKAIARFGEMVVFVPFVVPGDVVDIRLLKKKKNFAEGRAVHFHEYSDRRTEPFCMHFGLCGGCRWQNMKYEYQLFYKQKQVEDAFKRIGHLEYPGFLTILPSPGLKHYRNKLEFTFSDRRWLESGLIPDNEPLEMRGLGFHLPLMFDRIVDLQECHLQAEPSDSIRKAVREFTLSRDYRYYNVREHKGFLRNLVIRNSSLGDLMIIIVVAYRDDHLTGELVDFLTAAFPGITSVYCVANGKRNDDISDLEPELAYGKPDITEVLDGLKFRIGPLSFFQVNIAQAAVMYRTVKDWAALSGGEIVYDLYTGTGTIACYLASSARRVVGLEYLPGAVEDAIQNSSLNGLGNTLFFAGDIAEVLNPAFIAENGKPDLIIADPPRSGMSEKVIRQILGCRPSRMIYISCNPATQARDLALMKEHYRITRVQPLDMFPHTQHVENIACLELIGQG